MKKVGRSRTRKVRTTDAGKSGHRASSNVSANAEAVNERVRNRAYVLFEQRGRVDGFDLEDWLRAENQVKLGQGVG